MAVELNTISSNHLAVKIVGTKQAADRLACNRANHQQGNKSELVSLSNTIKIDVIGARTTAPRHALIPVTVRALFPNANGFLIPGAFVRIRVAGTPLHQALLVTDRAVGTDQGQKYLLIIDKDNIVHVRSVELGPESEGLRVVRGGLEGDEEIIINGIVNARPGSKVKPQGGDMNQFTVNQLDLQTTTKTEPVGDGKEKAGQISRHTRRDNRQVKVARPINPNLPVAARR